MTKQHRPSKAALPRRRRRSAGALSLQDPRHRHRVIPDKRRGKFKPIVRALVADNDVGATGVHWLDFVQCTSWETGIIYGLCRITMCKWCPFFGDGNVLDPGERVPS